MKKLLEFIVTHGNVNLVALSALLSMLDTEKAERFVVALFGIEDYLFPEDCPKVVTKDGRVYTFQDFNYLDDRVRATYPYKETRYYPNAEKAKDMGWDYTSKKKEGYEYETVTVCKGTSYFTLIEWKNLANFSENN